MQHPPLLAALGISQSLISARGLRPCDEAQQLEIAEVGEDRREHLLTPDAAEAWRRLKAAAEAMGIPLFIVSAFRSVDRQVEIIRRKLESGQSIKDILCVSAPPGFSEHHTGRAVDLGTIGVPLLSRDFERTDAFAWLIGNANQFGFLLSYPEGNPEGYQYEPWHWCYAAQPVVQADAAAPRPST